ncbi:hypothetical protein BGW41_002971 [Actinomortierella wolfii]|nr:hypothetical protein BGW41_002971 [Actinomortierella wolfii]
MSAPSIDSPLAPPLPQPSPPEHLSVMAIRIPHPLDLPPNPPSYEDVHRHHHPPTLPAPEYVDNNDNDNDDDLMGSLGIPSSSQHQQHRGVHTGDVVDEPPSYVMLDEHEPPWTLPSTESIKYTVLAHYGIGGEAEARYEAQHDQQERSPQQPQTHRATMSDHERFEHFSTSFASPSTPPPTPHPLAYESHGTYFHEVIARSPAPPPRQRRQRLYRSRHRRNSADNFDEDDDELDLEAPPAPVIYRRSSPWALEYWCEDTIMYLYFPIQMTEAQRGPEEMQAEVARERNEAPSTFRSSFPRFSRRGIGQQQEHAQVQQQQQIHEHEEQQQRQQVTAETEDHHPAIVPQPHGAAIINEEEARGETAERVVESTTETTTDRPHTQQSSSTASVPSNIQGIQAQQDLLSTTAVHSPIYETPSPGPPPPPGASLTHQIAVTDRPTINTVTNTANTTNTTTTTTHNTPTFALVSANDPVSCVWTSRVDEEQVERSVQNSIRDEVRPAWRVRGGGTGDEKIFHQGVVEGMQEELAACIACMPCFNSKRMRSASLEEIAAKNAARQLRLREACEIMVRVRGQYFAWRDVTHEKLGHQQGSRGAGTRTGAGIQSGLSSSSSLGSPPTYQPQTMTVMVSTLPQQQSEVERAHTRPTPILQRHPPSRTPSNARMFALYRDDHFELNKKKKGFCVAEVWVVHEEGHEQVCGTIVNDAIGQTNEGAGTLATTAPSNPGDGPQTLGERSLPPPPSNSSEQRQAAGDTFPEALRRRKCMIRIKQGMHHDIETFILTTGPRLVDLFDKQPRNNPVTTGHALLYAVLVLSVFIGWGIFFLTRGNVGWA